MYPINKGLRRGKIKAKNKASIVPDPACKDGKAPKTIGDPVNVDVYRRIPKSLSIAANPAGDPLME